MQSIMSKKLNEKNGNGNSTNNSGSHEQVELDELERKILDYLQKDGKASLRKIASELNAGLSAVKKRYDRLINLEVIKDFIAVVDCCKIGYREMLLFFVRTSSNVGIQIILDGLNEIDSINAIYQVSGSYPVFCMAKCVEKEDQIELLESVKRIDGIEEIITQVVLQRVKEDFRVSIPELQL
jgi:DNA-binding Lrp family transcriptional regulator